MIISRTEVESAISAYRSLAKRRVRNQIIPPAVDGYEHAEEPAALWAFSQAVAAEPFYRPTLVSDLNRRISEGRYFVPADQIVEKLLNRLIAEAVLA
jgi:hypothetical protein